MSANSSLQQELMDMQTHILCLGNQVRKRELRIEEFADYIPGSVMVQNLQSMTNTYMNKNGCEILHKSKEELMTMGQEFFKMYFPPEELAFNKKELAIFLAQDDGTNLHSFFQRVRPNIYSDYTWYFTTSKIIKSAENPFHSDLMNISVPISMLGSTGHRMRSLVENDEYMRKNLHQYSLLSGREKEIIKLIVAGKSSYEIADALYRSIHTINTHRKNIIHKIGVNSLAGLIKFAVAFNLV
jgi:LuxR family transcriptional regulator